MESQWASIKCALQGATMQRLQGLDDLRRLLEQPNSQLDREQLCDLVDTATELLRDNNHKVVQGILQVLSLIVIAASEPVKPHMNTLLPLVVERLGESRQAVRGSAFNLLLDMFNCIKPAYMLEKIARYWTHRAWKVRHGIIQTITQLVVDNNTPLLGTPEQSEYIINQVVNLVEDPESNVRTVVYECLKELWVVLDNVLLDNLKKQNIRPAVFKEVLTYLDEARPTNYTLPDNPAPPSTAAVTKRSVSRTSETNTATSAAPGLASQPSASKKAGARDLSVAASSPQEPAEPTPIYVTSDKELAAELDAMVTPLNGTVVDWQQRISHMQRLEGLALGCVPGMLEPLNECLKGLRDSMSKQLEDRRSAVEKQACMTLGLLSAVLGLRFQEHLVYYLPVLFKILPITVQVMAEAADTCVKTLLANCQSHRAIPVLAQTAIKDKNARIRHGCASYLADLLGSWEPQVILRCSDDLEAAMKSAVSDASGDARAAARRMYAGYAAIAPDVAQAFLRKLDPSVQDKLCKAASSTVPCKRALLPKPFLSRPSSSTSLASSTADSDIIIVAPHPPAPSQLGGVKAVRSSSGSMDLPTQRQDRRPPASRKSMASASRVLDSLLPEPAEEPTPQTYAGVGVKVADALGLSTPAGSDNSRVMSNPARRSSVNAFTASGLQPSAPLRVPAATPGPAPRPAEQPSMPAPRHVNFTSGPGPGPGPFYTMDMPQPEPASNPAQRPPTSSRGSIPLREQEQQQAPAQTVSKPLSFSKLAASLGAANKPWNVKVELLAAMTESLGTASGMTDGSEAAHLDPSRDIEKAAPKLLECLEDPHYKVALAVLELLRAVVHLHPTALDSSAERLLSALFSRQQDQKDAVRACVTDVLREMASHYSADVLLTGLIRALESNKQPKSKLSILEYGAAHIGRQCPAGIPSTNSTLLKQWLSRLAPLLTDKSVELRKKATEAVEAAQINVDAQAVHSFAQFCSGAEGIALRRVLSSLDARYRNDSQPAAPDTPGTAPAPANQQKPQPLALSPNAGNAWGSGAPGAPASTAHLSSAAAKTSPLALPRSHPLALTEDPTAFDTCDATVTATVGPRAAYTASDYMTPYKADPAKVACIGPLADPAPPKTSLPTVRTVSDPGELLPARDQGLLLVAGPTSSISAAGSTQPASLLGHLGGAGGGGGTGAAAAVAAGGSAGEPGAQVRMLSLLTHRLSSHVTHETMAQLIDAVGKYCTAAWEAGFPALLAVLTSKAIASSDAGIREMVMVLIEKLSAQHGVLVQPTPAIDALMQCVLTALQDTSKEVELAAADALRTLVLAAPAKQLLDVLAALLPSSPSPEMQAGGDRLCALCRALQRVFKSKAAPAMLARLQADLLPGLLLCADHQRVDVRKAAVFALAQAWHSIGDERFAVVVPSLSQSHGHLVRWAVGKLRAADKSGSDVMSCQ
ncbi:hypothetical protein QJQ45_014686 [Haematococcus lacustris]|nr:hypothetical protein QJQ45_014686 [Haematococcus lacustris]